MLLWENFLMLPTKKIAEILIQNSESDRYFLNNQTAIYS